MRDLRNAPLRILQVVSSRSAAYGGPVRTVAGITEAALNAGCEVKSFVADELGVVKTFLGRPAYWPGISGGHILARRIRWADLVHVHGLWTPANTLACRLAHRRGQAIVISPHGTLHTWALTRKRIKKGVYAALFERGNLRRATALHCLTGREVEQARRFGIGTPAFVVANGVPLSEASFDVKAPVGADRAEAASRIASRLAFESVVPAVPRRLVVLFLGRLVPQKGLDHLVPGFAIAKARAPDLHLVLAGPDEDGYRHRLEALVEKHGLEDSVTFTGVVAARERAALLQRADVFALTSRSEGDPVALKEAFAAGLPAVVTSACLPHDHHCSGAGGPSSDRTRMTSSSKGAEGGPPALVVGLNSGEVGAALVELARNPERRLELGRHARTYAHQHHSVERMGREMLLAYRDVISGTRGAGVWM